MNLTNENIKVFAASNYDNHSCLNEEEFFKDLNLTTTIKRMSSKYRNGHSVNLRLLVNNVITFYNCFEHHAATQLLEIKLSAEEIPYVNSLLKFLSLPLMKNDALDSEFMGVLEEEIK